MRYHKRGTRYQIPGIGFVLFCLFVVCMIYYSNTEASDSYTIRMPSAMSKVQFTTAQVGNVPVSGMLLLYVHVEPREGDVPSTYFDPTIWVRSQIKEESFSNKTGERAYLSAFACLNGALPNEAMCKSFTQSRTHWNIPIASVWQKDYKRAVQAIVLMNKPALEQKPKPITFWPGEDVLKSFTKK